jgi:hypothetical protein
LSALNGVPDAAVDEGDLDDPPHAADTNASRVTAAMSARFTS